MKNNYLTLLNAEGNEKFREIILEKDFSEYQRKLKKLVTLQKRLKNIENTLFGPITKIEAFHQLNIYQYTIKQPIMIFDLVDSKVTFYRKQEGFSRGEDDKIKVDSFSLDKLCLFNERTILTLRILALDKIKKYENKKKDLKKRNKSKGKNNYSYSTYTNVEMEDDLLEHFLILLVSNYNHISYANSDIKKAITNYRLINQFINFSAGNDGITNKVLENFVNIFSKYVIRNIDENSYEPSLEGLNELLDIQNNCLTTCHDNLSKEPKYNSLIDEYLILSYFVLEYEKKLPNF